MAHDSAKDSSLYGDGIGGRRTLINSSVIVKSRSTTSPAVFSANGALIETNDTSCGVNDYQIGIWGWHITKLSMIKISLLCNWVGNSINLLHIPVLFE